MRRWIDLIPEGYDIFDVMLFVVIMALLLSGIVMSTAEEICKVCK